MKNYIGLNIKYLYEKNFLSQDEFGELFGLKKSVIGTYVRENSVPKIETIQRICKNFEISIDDFVNRPLSEVSKMNIAKEPESHYGLENELMATKDKIIALLEAENERLKETITDLKSKKSNSA
ncbi:hypothetical protein FLJC2902T_17180 [Flavobacterium limnosediminis JC2902]|uniref:HTH cro/C1-type domain-containing protein n=1 Tax=Flavobacterium limnosediminis JC2902 TaxID=1341181 RepID=V6SQ76_9FLAO|nr:helix-turn-helix transcriptional regulator [Flavobacterium limnosediminis]ESU28367.1 hypothetical protein FLJC2902T_17180 [Flavobacterium limnosediminis JC2902]